MLKTSLRIHPSIGFARVGNSEQYYIGPETSAGLPVENQDATGGLPIKPDTESTTITSADLRDSEGRLKRQAARFRIYQYEAAGSTGYPCGSGTEVTIGSTVDGKVVKDIVWTVHLANKKANCWRVEAQPWPGGLEGYKDNKQPPLRNPKFGRDHSTSSTPPDPGDQTRLRQLIIDAGPRTINGSERRNIAFDKDTIASYCSPKGDLTELPHYPKSFPASIGANHADSSGSQPIRTLGEMTTDAHGRLLLLGAYGRACGFDNQGQPKADAPLNEDVDNDNWLDDTADGPVTAWLVFDNNTRRPVDSGAWVVSADPAYAPQARNVVTLWDDILTTWIEKFELRPDIYRGGRYKTDFLPSFDDHVFPVLRAASLQMWTTNLPKTAIDSHRNLDRLTASKPTFNILSFIRNPNDKGQLKTGSPLMPLSLGDNQKSFMTLTTLQYFFIQQWNEGKCHAGKEAKKPGPGEALDQAVLSNCLGGRFSPGIDLTFIVRDATLYKKDWQQPTIGPFRINMRELDYSTAIADKPFLGVGYIPLTSKEQNKTIEPGDLCKFMSIPWHTDYNSCATHVPDPNPRILGPNEHVVDPDSNAKLTHDNVYGGRVNTTLFWSWPAQRPVAVYTYEDLAANEGKLPVQRYSVRGEGTAAVHHDSADKFDAPAMNVGRYQERRNILLNWDKIGFVIQGVAINDYDAHFSRDYYLEVQSRFREDRSNLVEPWPNTVTDRVHPPKNRKQ